MTKKLMLLAVSAAAVVAFAIPASASAAMFKHEGHEITTPVTKAYSGPAQFEGTSGGVPTGSGIACESVTASVTFSTNSAEVDSFTGTNCETFGPLNELANCHTSGAPVANTPFAVDIESSETLNITGVSIDQGIAAGCGFPGFGGGGTNHLTGNVSATVVGGPEVEHLTLSGAVSTSFGEADVSGTLTAENSTEVTLE